MPDRTATTPDPPATPRWVELHGVHNARDLGGLPAACGRTRFGVLYRSDNLDRLTPNDLDVITGRLRLRTIVDLRSPGEFPAQPPGWWDDGRVARVSMPLLGDAAPAVTRDGGRPRSTGGRPSTNLGAIYRTILDTRGRSLAAILTLAAGGAAAPLLLHCAAGKDRTGVATAVLLAAAGVEPAAIVADYAATTERMPRVASALAAAGHYLPDPAGPDADLLLSPARVMAGLLDRLNHHPGGAVGYIVAHGADRSAVDRWRTTLIDEH